jgi:endonuclease-3
MPRTASPASPDRRSLARSLGKKLRELYPTAHCALNFRDPFELLVATILSAQCTDVRVNLVTPELFRQFPDARALAAAPLETVMELIHSTGFFRAKATNLIGMAQGLVADHGGEVPRDLEALVRLPGVGRKTANVVLGNAFGIASGVVVDTHVKRLAYRMGLTDEASPEAVERDLEVLFPRTQWVDLSHRLIAHGRSVCTALRPKCTVCEIRRICPQRLASR